MTFTLITLIVTRNLKWIIW